MRLVISGAGGFLGRNLITKAVEEGMDVVALTSKEEQLREIYGENVTVVNKEKYETLTCMDETVLINCAFPMDMQGTTLAKGMNYIKDLLTNSNNNCSAIINISSQSVYRQDKEEAFEEDGELYLDTPYSIGKYMTEMLTDIICRDIPHTNVRMASLLGQGSDRRIVNRLIQNSQNGGGIELHVGKQLFG